MSGLSGIRHQEGIPPSTLNICSWSLFDKCPLNIMWVSLRPCPFLLCHTAISPCLNRFLTEALSSLYQFVHPLRVPVWLVQKGMPLSCVHCSVHICVYLKFITTCNYHSCLDAADAHWEVPELWGELTAVMHACIYGNKGNMKMWVYCDSSYYLWLHVLFLCKHPHIVLWTI